MNKNSHWKGYDMEQIRILRATNELRIEIEKANIARMFAVNSLKYENAGRMFASASDFVEAAEYGVKTYKIVKKITNLFRQNKK